MSGPRAMALSTQRPVTTMWAPRSRQRRIGTALPEQGPGEPMSNNKQSTGSQQSRCESVFVPQVGVHTVEGRRQLADAAIPSHLDLRQALPLTTEESLRSMNTEGEVRLPVDTLNSNSFTQVGAYMGDEVIAGHYSNLEIQPGLLDNFLYGSSAGQGVDASCIADHTDTCGGRSLRLTLIDRV